MLRVFPTEEPCFSDDVGTTLTTGLLVVKHPMRWYVPATWFLAMVALFVVIGTDAPIMLKLAAVLVWLMPLVPAALLPRRRR
jgi:hypothetical protein